MSRTYLGLLHYDGREFAGWQRQREGRTVQAEIERVLARLCGRRIIAHAAGRTDAGVHALGMGVSFVVPDRWEAPTLTRALNALLSRDCWVERVSEMQPGFQARKSAQARRYRYLVGSDAAAASPFRRRYEWALGRPLELARLEQAAAVLPGIHDFHAFAIRRPSSAESPGREPYRCRIREATWTIRPEGRGAQFDIAADRFLHHMVRFLVGTMVDVGLGRRPIADMQMLLDSTSNQNTSPPAPPEGLYFVAAEYGGEWFVGEEAREEEGEEARGEEGEEAKRRGGQKARGDKAAGEEAMGDTATGDRATDDGAMGDAATVDARAGVTR
jgi:tRNA pseudouridine38-40 synthase